MSNGEFILIHSRYLCYLNQNLDSDCDKHRNIRKKILKSIRKYSYRYFHLSSSDYVWGVELI